MDDRIGPLSNPSGDGADYVQQNAIFVAAKVDEMSIMESRSHTGVRGMMGIEFPMQLLRPIGTPGDTDVLNRELAYTMRNRPGHQLTSEESDQRVLIRTSLNGVRSNRVMPNPTSRDYDELVEQEVAENFRVLGQTEGVHRVAHDSGTSSSQLISVQVTGTAMMHAIDAVDAWQILVARPAKRSEQSNNVLVRHGTSANKALLYARPWTPPNPSLSVENELYMAQLKKFAELAPKHHQGFMPAATPNKFDPFKVEQMAKGSPVSTDVLDGLAVKSKQYLLLFGALERIFKSRIRALYNRVLALPDRMDGDTMSNPDKHLKTLLTQEYQTGATVLDANDIGLGLQLGLSDAQLQTVYTDPTVMNDIELIVQTCMAAFQVSFRNVVGTSMSEARPGQGMRVLMHPM